MSLYEYVQLWRHDLFIFHKKDDTAIGQPLLSLISRS